MIGNTVPRLAELTEWQAARRPHALALRFEGRDLRYLELARQVKAGAGQLMRWGVRAGDRVAWLGLNLPGQLALLFALARIGAVLVPLNFRLAPAEWRGVLADCSPRLLVHDAAWRDAAQSLGEVAGLAVHGVDTLCAGADNAPAVDVAMPPDDAPLLLVYTSGTTGQPRAAVHTHANLRANMAAAITVQQLVDTDTVLTVLPLFHVGGLCIQTLPALGAGAAVLLHARFEPQATLQAVAHDRPTLTLQVPATMAALIAQPQWAQADLSSLRAVWAGSSVLPAHLVEAFNQRGLPVCNVYGATESGPFSVALGPSHAASHAGSCGWPAPGVEVRLHDAKDGVGEVLLRAPNVVRHYWPDVPALDAAGWFHSGDLARQAADGSYTIVGRLKDMIISGGENIYPAEIENLLARHPAVAECAVLGLPDARWGEQVVAAVVLRADAARDAGEAQLLAYMAPHLARYKQPRRVFALDALPRTALGKVQKAVLAGQLKAMA